MFKFKKYIAFFLFLVFTFPVIYQQVHIMQHHAIINCHTDCDNHYNTHNNIEPVNPKTISFSVSNENKTCAICEYQFTINQMPVVYQFSKSNNYFSKYRFPFTGQHLICSYICGKSSRAPPPNYSVLS